MRDSSNEPNKKKSASARDKEAQGYETMMSRVHDALEHFDKKAEPVLQDLVDQAKRKAVELEELTEDEAEKVSAFLLRDLQHAANFLRDTRKGLADWLYFDWQLLEDKLWDMFNKVADRTRIELLEFDIDLRHGLEYHGGEVTGPGTLKCESCGETVQYHKVEVIQPCEQCHHKIFQRLA